MRRSNVMLWTIQGVLAAGFLFAGGMKIVTPAATLAPMIAPLPLALIRFVGTCEVLGALGLILPGLFRIRPSLTPLAAAGLVVIMSGAVSASITMHKFADAVPPAILGLLAIAVISGRVRCVTPA